MLGYAAIEGLGDNAFNSTSSKTDTATRKEIHDIADGGEFQSGRLQG